MDNQLLLGSVIINCLLIIERILSRVKKSKCCNSEIEMTTNIQKSKSELNLSNIKVDESLQTITTE